EVTQEIFGPVLQVVRWGGDPMAVMQQINALGYGLTLGIQTRIDSRALALAGAARVGNVYVNRNMIGAVVGVQPFGGEGLSGTGPKAGGPHYLLRFCAEQTLTINTTAAGGNVALFTG
ncbi:MAG: aldehyde dehydrogenase family protein, partial [Hydrogenophaga sp.]|nr:aldehyde dehydrogenase family protein [Hydrogenophaga sp.]